MTTVTAYKCGYCGRIYQRKGSAEKHERECYNNPEVKGCNTCKYKYDGCTPLKLHINSGSYHEFTQRTGCNYHERRDTIAD